MIHMQKLANPNSDFAFYGTLAKELAQGDLLGVKDQAKKSLKNKAKIFARPYMDST